MKRIVGVLLAFLSFSALADCACNSGTGTTYSSSSYQSSPSYQMGLIPGCTCNRNRIPANAASSPYYFSAGSGCGAVVPYWPPCRNPNGEDYGYYSSSVNVIPDQNNVVLYMGY